MKYFIFLFFFISTQFNPCNALTLSVPTDSVSVKKNTTDSTKKRFMVYWELGTGIPEKAYGHTLENTATTPYSNINGYALTGFHFDINVAYMVQSRIGLIGRFGIDINESIMYGNPVPLDIGPGSPNYVYQYMGGIYYSAWPTLSKFNLYALGMVGETVVDMTTNDFNEIRNLNTYGGIELPNIGYGLALYGGMGLVFKPTKKTFITLSTGYLASNVNFQNGSIHYGLPDVPKYDMTMSMGIIQVNLGIVLNF